MNTNTLVLAIIGHLVGDYLLQNDWMALNKKKAGSVGRLACLTHSYLWACTVCLFAGWAKIFFVMSSPAFWLLWFAHYWQDRTNVVMWWMTKVNRQEKFATGPCAPWSIIVVDNVWHIVSLWVVWRWIA